MIYEFIKTGNYWEGRGGLTPEAIVIHITDGPASACIDWFLRPESQVSAHYLVTRKGRVYQFVKERDSAWHAGRVVKPRWRLLREGVNPNYYTIGIEMEGWDEEKPTFIQTVVTAILIGVIAKRWKIPLDKDHVIGHNQIDRRKACPGRNIDPSALAWLAKIIYKG